MVSGSELKHGADPYCRFPVEGGAPPGRFWGGGGGGGGIHVTAAWAADQAAVVVRVRVRVVTLTLTLTLTLALTLNPNPYPKQAAIVAASRVSDALGRHALVCAAPMT